MINRILMELYDDFEKDNLDSLLEFSKKTFSNEETQNFVAKYMGEINSIVLEKLHISEDMKDYFENYDDLTKSQREKFESYMRNPYINDLRSKVMSSTIRLFFDLYGADGNNEDFQELLEYAHNIKPERIARQKEHDRIQELYVSYQYHAEEL